MADVPSIESVLAEHDLRGRGGYGWCKCGGEFFAADEFGVGDHFRAHLAAVLEAREQRVKAEAWDEGYARGVRDEAGDIERADNPYRPTTESEDR